MKFKNYYYLDKTVEPFSYVDLGGNAKISGSSSGVSINKDLKLENGDLEIAKGKKIRFVGNDNDPYYIEKIGNTDSNHLRLTINDNNNESLQIWGNSCGTTGCGGAGIKQHEFDASGNAMHKGTVTASNFKRANGDSCTIRYGGCDGVHWGKGTGYGNEYFDRLGGSVSGIADCNSDEYLKGFGITRCNSGRGLQLKMRCCKR